MLHLSASIFVPMKALSLLIYMIELLMDRNKLFLLLMLVSYFLTGIEVSKQGVLEVEEAGTPRVKDRDRNPWGATVTLG